MTGTDSVVLLTHLDGDFTDGPRRIVAHRNIVWVEIRCQDWHKLSWNES